MPSPLRQAERGAALVLALLVMLILAVVVTQLFYSSSVDLRISEHQSVELQMEGIAVAALRKGEVVLIMDLEEDLQAGDEGAAPDEGGGGVPGIPGGGGDMTGGGGEEPRVDSLDEGWALADVPFDLGNDQDLIAKIYIVDEDSKYNALLLGTRNEDYRLEWRERFIRALDIMRDGKPRDLDSSTADEIIMRIEEWMRGDRQNSDEVPVAPLATGDWIEELGQAFYPPFSLREVALGAGGDDSLYYGFGDPEWDPEDESDEPREWIPGIDRVLTVWTNLELAEDTTATGPGDPGQPGGDPGGDQDAGGGSPDEEPPEAEGVNNGRLNLNTAPMALLRGLMPQHEVSPSAWDEFEELREETMTEIRENLEDFWADEEEDEEELRRREEENLPYYPLESVEDLRRFEAFAEDNPYLDPEVWKKLSSLLTVESNVFSIYAVVSTTIRPHRYYIARRVVWRRVTEAGAETIQVLPFERLSPETYDLSVFNAELADWVEE